MLDRSFYLLMAAGWVAIGLASYNTGNVPLGGSGLWLVLCSIPAGTLVSLVRHTSDFALRMYLWVATLVGGLRGVLYLFEDGQPWAPISVWFLLAATTLLAFRPSCRTCLATE